MSDDRYRRLVRSGLAPLVEDVPEGPDWEDLVADDTVVVAAPPPQGPRGWIVGLAVSAVVLVLVGLAVVLSPSAPPQNPGPPSPELSQEDQAELIVTAIRIACSDLCVGQPLYFRDQLLDIDTLVGEEEPMPEATRTAIEDAYPEVVWVDFDAADEILEQVDNAEAVLLSVSGFSELAPGVQGVDVGIIHGAFHGQTIQFQWNGSEWIQADSEDTGVTVTSVVS